MSMTKQVDQFHSLRSQRLSSDQRHFNLIFAAAFIVLVFAFAFARLLPGSRSLWATGNERRNGVIARARAEANILASCALMR